MRATETPAFNPRHFYRTPPNMPRSLGAPTVTWEPMIINVRQIIFDKRPAWAWQSRLRGRPFNFWGGVGDFEKNFLRALVGRKNCMQRKWNRKKIIALLQARKKKCCKAISSFLGGFTNPSKTATIPDILQASEPLWLAYKNNTLIGLNNTLVSLNNTPFGLQLA